jgi:hypothetical protein
LKQTNKQTYWLGLSERIGNCANASPLSEDEDLVRKAAETCSARIATLLHTLESLKVELKPDGSKSWYRSGSAVVKMRYKRSDIENQQRDVEEAKSSLGTALLVLMRCAHFECFSHK